MNYVYYSLILKENNDVELKGCIDLDTIDDDQPDSEYLQNNGTWDSHAPHYWKTNGEDQTHLLETLQEIEVYEWDWISQALCDVVSDATSDEVFIREFDKATLYMSCDGDFEAENATKLPNGIIVKNNYPFKE